MKVSLRSATAADRCLLGGIFASTRVELLAQLSLSEEQKALFVAQQFDAQDVDYRRRYPNASFDLVTVAGRVAGRLYVDRGRREIRVIDISLLPEFRGRGVGTKLMTTICREAAQTGKNVILAVDPTSAAVRLYRRLGFREVESVGTHLTMEWAKDISVAPERRRKPRPGDNVPHWAATSGTQAL